MFYNGFRAAFPWLGLFLVGMLIGRKDLRSPTVQRMFFWSGITIWLTAELTSFGLLSLTLPLGSPAGQKDLLAILGTNSLPPMPLFLLAAGGFATAFIFGCAGDWCRSDHSIQRDFADRCPHRCDGWILLADVCRFLALPNQIQVWSAGSRAPESDESLIVDSTLTPVSYTHLTLPTICSV